MSFVIITVFLAAIFVSFISRLLPFLTKLITSILVGKSAEDEEVNKRLRELMLEIRNINMVDEFAKYAKVERKINAIKDQLNKSKSGKSSVLTKVQLGMTIAVHVIQFLVFVSIIWFYRYQPLLVLPPAWLWPLGYVISFPTNVSGAVGVTFWMLTSRSVINKLSLLLR